MHAVILSKDEAEELADLIQLQHRLPHAAERLDEWAKYLKGHTGEPSPYERRRQQSEG